MISLNPFKKILDARRRHEKFNLTRKIISVYDAFVGDDNDQDRNNYLGLFDYLTLFLPFALNRLTVGLLNTPIDLPVIPMLIGMIFVVNCLAIAARHLLSGIITAVASPFVVAAHGMAKLYCKPELDEFPEKFRGTHASMPFEPRIIDNQAKAKPNPIPIQAIEPKTSATGFACDGTEYHCDSLRP